MSDPIEELVMKALVTTLQGITVTGSPLFKTVYRGRIVTRSLDASVLPAAGVYRILDRESKLRSPDRSKINFVFGVDIAGAQTTQPTMDTELVSLKSYVKNALNRNTLGGLVGSINYRGSDTSTFAAIAQGREVMAFETLMVLSATDAWSQN
jgi:hypothetical protein